MAELTMFNSTMRDPVVPPTLSLPDALPISRRNLGYPTSGRRLRVRSRVRRSASGRRGAVADDARAWEGESTRMNSRHVAICYAICCGVKGEKGGGEGECAPSKHSPDTAPGW